MIKIGDLLIKENLINEKQLNMALKINKKEKILLGELLIKLGFVSEKEIVKILARQLKVEYIELNSIEQFDLEVLKLVDREFCLENNLIPLKINENNELEIVIDNTENSITINKIRKRLNNIKTKLKLSEKSSIRNYIMELYDLEIEKKIEKEFEELSRQEEPNMDSLMKNLLNNGIKKSSTDIHLVPEENYVNVYFRIEGILTYFNSLDKKVVEKLSSKIKVSADIQDHLNLKVSHDGSFSHSFLKEEFEIRFSSIPSDNGENIVLRILPKKIQSNMFNLKDLGLEEDLEKKIKEYTQKPYGIILVSGPTGSGKTTTLYTMLKNINYLERKVITIEDPIEYKFDYITQTQVNLKAGYTFENAIRSFLRQDPDVMLVGEIRDEKTASLAVHSAQTGHLILSTIHANDAVSVLPRLKDLNIDIFSIQSALLGVISQRLVRKVCNHCKIEKKLTKEEMVSKYNLTPEERIELKEEEYTIYEKGEGCSKCNDGYSGRTIVMEFLEMTSEMKNIISEEQNIEMIKQIAKTGGMKTMKQNALLKVLKGETTFEEIKRVIL